MIKIIDYGLGNVKAFINAFNRLNVQSSSIREINEINISDKIILPGVGHFDDAMRKLTTSFDIKQLNDIVLVQKTPILGVCVGMQILANSSEEGDLKGLGWIDSEIIKLSDKKSVILPHMGWNKLDTKSQHQLLDGIEPNSNRFYFLHSYIMKCSQDIVMAETNYSNIFPTVINVDNIFGIQCHPEKSHDDGLKFLYNYSKL